MRESLLGGEGSVEYIAQSIHVGDSDKGFLQRPLHRVPVLLKDHIWTLNKSLTTAGSYALLGGKSTEEASIVTRLRKAGAILLGKANMSEWAIFRSMNSSDGWSPRGGQTMGPYYPRSSLEGSSSGSCVATALGLAFEAIGTEAFIILLELEQRRLTTSRRMRVSSSQPRSAILLVSKRLLA